jgi:hypothetical protein
LTGLARVGGASAARMAEAGATVMTTVRTMPGGHPDPDLRRAEDPLRVRAADAAGNVVLKVQPLGGVRAALAVAEACGLPVVVSSAVFVAADVSTADGTRTVIDRVGARFCRSTSWSTRSVAPTRAPEASPAN